VSLNNILDSALSGLSAAQAGLRTVSNNIANAQTPGYARQRVSQSSAVTSGRTTGVTVSEPSRVADRYLETTVYARGGDAGQKAIVSSYYDRLQSTLGTPGAVSGFPARFSALIAAADEMTGMSDPTEAIAKFVGTAEDSISAIRDLEKEVDTLSREVTGGMTDTVGRINALLKELNNLNEDIRKQTAQGIAPTGLADQRQTALQELSGLVSIKVVEQTDGRVTVETKNGLTLLDGRLRQLDLPTAGSGPIAIRMTGTDGVTSVATGDVINSAAVGGKLGGLIEVRDKVLPDLTNDLNAMFSGLAETLNKVSNGATTVPAPHALEGRSTGLLAADRLGFTGAATFAVLNADGTLMAKTSVDFSALGAGATVQDAIDAINTGLGGMGTASFVDGALTITATNAAHGIAVAQDPATPSDRAGVGFAQFFGLNDMVRSATSPLVPLGFNASDPHGFGTGESVGMELRDAGGKLLASYTLTGSGGPTVGALLTELNASPLAAHGSFSLDDRGRVRFAPSGGVTGLTIGIGSDSTDRFGTGLSFSEWSGLGTGGSGLGDAAIKETILGGPKNMPLALLDTTVAVGEKAASKGDVRGATAMVAALAKAVDLGKDGSGTIMDLSNRLVGKVGTETARARTAQSSATARFDEAVDRRDSFSGVNTEEELALMVVLQNSYSASARIVTVASDMYDILINLVR